MSLFPSNIQFRPQYEVTQAPTPALPERVAAFSAVDQYQLWDLNGQNLASGVVDYTPLQNRHPSRRAIHVLDSDIDATTGWLYLLLINAPSDSRDPELPRTQVWRLRYEGSKLGVLRYVRDVERIDSYNGPGGGVVERPYVAAHDGILYLAPSGNGTVDVAVYDIESERQLQSITVDTVAETLRGIYRVHQVDGLISLYDNHVEYDFSSVLVRRRATEQEQWDISAPFSWHPTGTSGAGDDFIAIPGKARANFESSDPSNRTVFLTGQGTNIRVFVSDTLSSSRAGLTYSHRIDKDVAPVFFVLAPKQPATQGGTVLKQITTTYVSSATIPEFRTFGSTVTEVLSISPASRQVVLDLVDAELPQSFYTTNDFVRFQHDGIDYTMASIQHTEGELTARAIFTY